MYQEKLTILAGGSTRETRPRANLARFHVAGETITDVDIWVDFPVSVGSNTFNLMKNGVPQFVGGSRPTIAAAGSHIHIGGLSITTADGDILSFDLEVVGSAGVNLPIYFRLTTADTGGGGNSWDETIVKPTTESRNTTTTYAADTDLRFDIDADGVYAFEGFAWVTCDAGSVEAKFRHHFTQTPQFARIEYEFINTFVSLPSASSPNASAYETATTGADHVIGSGGFFALIHFKGAVKGHATNPSEFQLQWTQNASDANNVNVENGSVLSYKKA